MDRPSPLHRLRLPVSPPVSALRSGRVSQLIAWSHGRYLFVRWGVTPREIAGSNQPIRVGDVLWVAHVRRSPGWFFADHHHLLQYPTE